MTALHVQSDHDIHCPQKLLVSTVRKELIAGKKIFLFPFNSPSNDKNLDWLKLKAFGDNIINM